MEVNISLKVMSVFKAVRVPLMRSASLGGNEQKTQRRKKSNFTSTSSHTSQNYLNNRQLATLQVENQPSACLPAFAKAHEYRHRIALSDKDGDFLYDDVYRRSRDLAVGLKGVLGEDSINRNICFMCNNGASYVITLWATWMSGNVAVPLSKIDSPERIEAQIRESGSPIVIATKHNVDKVQRIAKTLNKKLIVLDNTWTAKPKQHIDPSSPLPSSLMDDDFYIMHPNALVLYHSNHNGVVLRHDHLGTRTETVANAWGLEEKDAVLHALPLDNSFGIVNGVMAPMARGSRVVMLPQFDTVKVWSHLLGVGLNSTQINTKITVFPSIPIHYMKLIQQHSKLFKEKKLKDYVRNTCLKRIRLMTSGITSLPDSLLSEWQAKTGFDIVETYSTDEVGTAMSGKIQAEPTANAKKSVYLMPDMRSRIIRFVDKDRKKYEILADVYDNSARVINPKYIGQDIVGELLIKGSSVFSEYAAEDDSKFYNGWFLTGDIAELNNGGHRIIGRVSTGETVTPVREPIPVQEIEQHILEHEHITDCCVVGLLDSMTHEQQVVATVCLDYSDKTHKLDDILEWCATNLSENEHPTLVKILPKMPLDQNGNIDRLEVARTVLSDEPLLFLNNK